MSELIQDGPPADEGCDSERDKNEAKCVIIHKNKVFKWYLATDNAKNDDNQQAFQNFCQFLEDDIGVANIEIDNMDDTVEIFLINDKDDIDNDSHQIESPDDFGDVFEDFNPDSDPRQVYYFVIKVEFLLHVCFVVLICFSFNFLNFFLLLLFLVPLHLDCAVRYHHKLMMTKMRVAKRIKGQ